MLLENSTSRVPQFRILVWQYPRSLTSGYEYDTIRYIDVAAVENRRVLAVKEIPLESAPSRAKRIVKSDDILISTVRPNLKHFCLIRDAEPNLVASTGFAVISANKNTTDP